MELVVLIAALWILVLPVTTVSGLLCASALIRRRSCAAHDGLAVVVPLHPPAGAPGRRIA